MIIAAGAWFVNAIISKPMAKPNPKAVMAVSSSRAKLGQGGRFAALKNKLADRPGVTDPGALAAAIGRKKLGATKFNALAAKGKKGK